jgi:hypothetical protein
VFKAQQVFKVPKELLVYKALKAQLEHKEFKALLVFRAPKEHKVLKVL